MTRDQILEMAREAGLQLAINAETYPVITGQLERFAAMVAAAEREACAKVCELNGSNLLWDKDCAKHWPKTKADNERYAAAIRARKDQQ